jgi:hypothetical protein
MDGRLFDDADRLFDHDVQTCAVCRPKNDYWLDMPCPDCGHAFDEGTSTYVDVPDRANYRTDWVLCHRCRLAVVVYGGFSVFTYDETGPGGDLHGYRCEGESGPDDAQRTSTRKAVRGVGKSAMGRFVMAANPTIEQVMERMARLETMLLVPGPRDPGDLAGRLWNIEDQLESLGALSPAVVRHLPLPEADDLRLGVIDGRLAMFEHLCDVVLKGWLPS